MTRFSALEQEVLVRGSLTFESVLQNGTGQVRLTLKQEPVLRKRPGQVRLALEQD